MGISKRPGKRPRRDSRALTCLLVSATCIGLNEARSAPLDLRGRQFIAISDLSKFARSPGANPGELVLTSPAIATRLAWNELVASWNLPGATNTALKIEVRAIYPEAPTKYYGLGFWTADTELYPRASVAHQKDRDGYVSTDTLILVRPCQRLQLRLTISGSDGNALPCFLGLSLADNRQALPPLRPNRAAWRKTVEVPERSQMAYPDGKVLCSPTTVCMLMSFWGEKLSRPQLARDVPEITAGVYDSVWQGAGNWAFNMAYIGEFAGMRGCVARFSDVSELEDWIAAGLPVGLSVCYNKLRGRENSPPSGHLVVCVGFDSDGDPIINDPGTSKNVRKTFSRQNLIKAWAYSRNAVYLIYPETARLPTDRFGHWDSAAARKLWRFDAGGPASINAAKK